MCATVYKSGKAIREVYGKHALIHKSSPPLRAFVVHNEPKKAQRLVIGGRLAPLPPSSAGRAEGSEDEDVVDPAEHYRLPELTKRLMAGLSKHLRKDLAIELAGHALGGIAAILLAEALAQAGYKVAMVTTFGQPRFRSSPPLSGSASGVLPLRVVSRTDPVYRLFPGSSGHHHGPELVLLPDLAFFYASPALAPSSTSPSSASPPALPTSPLSRRAAGAKGKQKLARRDSEGGGKTIKDEKKKNNNTKKDKKDNHRRDRSPSPEKKENRSPSPPTSPAAALLDSAASGEEDDVETSAEHRMESYLRNLKAKVRGTPYRVHLLT